jgi:hypothetical protein
VRFFRTVLLFLLTHACLLTAATNYRLAFSTYLGGSGTDSIQGSTVDSQGNVYITGYTTSSNFPTTTGAYDRTFNGVSDVFVVKMSASGSIIWSTVVGGPNNELGIALRVDSQGNVYVGGAAESGFPTTTGAFQRTHAGGGRDAIIFKLSPDGASLLWSTYFGSSDAIDGLRDIAIDSAGNVAIATGFEGGTWPSAIASKFVNSPAGAKDAVAALIKSDGTQVLWSRYVGGSGDDSYAGTVQFDSSGNVYLLTFTVSSNILTTTGAYDRTYNGGEDAYLIKLSSNGQSVIFATFLGGSQDEAPSKHQMALDGQGNIVIVGTTRSADFPTTPGAYQPVFAGSNSGIWERDGDIFISKISANGAQLLASTFLGGSWGETVETVVVGSTGDIFLSGGTKSSGFPVTANAYQKTLRGWEDGVFVRFSGDLSTLIYSTYMGGSAGSNISDSFRAVGLDAAGNVYLAGDSGSADWPTLNPVQASFGGGRDVVAVRFTLEASTVSCDVNTDSLVNVIDVQLAVNQTLGTTPCGTADLNGDGQCNVIDVQRIINAALGASCVIGP